MSTDSNIPAFFEGLAEAIAEGLKVVEIITDNLPIDPDKALRITTRSGTRYLIVLMGSQYFLGRQAVGVSNRDRDWSVLKPNDIEPLPGGSVDFGSWRCTSVQKIELINRKGESLGWFYQIFPPAE